MDRSTCILGSSILATNSSPVFFFILDQLLGFNSKIIFSILSYDKKASGILLCGQWYKDYAHYCKINTWFNFTCPNYTSLCSLHLLISLWILENSPSHRESLSCNNYISTWNLKNIIPSFTLQKNFTRFLNLVISLQGALNQIVYNNSRVM